MTISDKIAIVGLGNVGTHLALKLFSLDFPLAQLVTSSEPSALAIFGAFSAETIHDVAQLDEEISVVFLCVPDDHIASVASKIPANKTVVHCSGSTAMLADRQLTGVMYMFQTFSKHRATTWEDIPIFIESNDLQVEKWLVMLAKALSSKVEKKSSEERKLLHLAGVFACNFVNHMIFQAEAIVKEAGGSIETLKPLIEETISKAIIHGAYASQTGPARRGDINLINHHMAMLAGDDELSELYSIISKRIISTYAP